MFIACTTFCVVATPLVVGSFALPLSLAISAPLVSSTVIPLALAVVEIKSLPLIFNVPFSNRTSLSPLLPAYFKLTLLNWATLTASVSSLPAARPVIWRVAVAPLPTATAPRVEVWAVPVKPLYVFVRESAGLKPCTPAAAVVAELEPRATPSAISALLPSPIATVALPSVAAW